MLNQLFYVIYCRSVSSPRNVRHLFIVFTCGAPIEPIGTIGFTGIEFFSTIWRHFVSGYSCPKLFLDWTCLFIMDSYLQLAHPSASIHPNVYLSIHLHTSSHTHTHTHRNTPNQTPSPPRRRCTVHRFSTPPVMVVYILYPWPPYCCYVRVDLCSLAVLLTSLHHNYTSISNDPEKKETASYTLTQTIFLLFFLNIYIMSGCLGVWLSGCLPSHLTPIWVKRLTAFAILMKQLHSRCQAGERFTERFPKGYLWFLVTYYY